MKHANEREEFVNSCAIHSQIESGHNSTLKHLLLRKKYREDDQGHSYLLHALFAENFELVDHLLDLGQSLNLLDIDFFTLNKDVTFYSREMEMVLASYLQKLILKDHSQTISLLTRILFKREFGLYVRLCERLNLDHSGDDFKEAFKELQGQECWEDSFAQAESQEP